MPALAPVGDVMLGRGVGAALRHMRPQGMWGDVLPHLLQADLRIANLECALTRHAQPWTRSWKMFHFRTDHGAGRLLQAAHIDACSLDNNHTLELEHAACWTRCTRWTRPASATPAPASMRGKPPDSP